MKKILFFLITPVLGFGQYSTYYGTYDINANINQNVNVTQDVNVSGNINKTIQTIDYGALRLANAQREKNRLEAQVYSDNLQKNQALEIASNPIKAFDYGKDNYWVMDKENAEERGFSKRSTYYHKIPNEALFVSTGGYNYRNESIDGVVTELEFNDVRNLFTSTYFLKMKKDEKKQIIDGWKPYLGKTEEYVKKEVSRLKVGEKFEDKFFTHKININKAKVFGFEGYVYTWCYEDDYEFVIKDNYFVIGENGVYIQTGVRYRGDKDFVDFEMLEGRRAYLKRLCDQIIATASISLKKGFNK